MSESVFVNILFDVYFEFYFGRPPICQDEEAGFTTYAAANH